METALRRPTHQYLVGTSLLVAHNDSVAGRRWAPVPGAEHFELTVDAMADISPWLSRALSMGIGMSERGSRWLNHARNLGRSVASKLPGRKGRAAHIEPYFDIRGRMHNIDPEVTPPVVQQVMEELYRRGKGTSVVEAYARNLGARDKALRELAELEQAHPDALAARLERQRLEEASEILELHRQQLAAKAAEIALSNPRFADKHLHRKLADYLDNWPPNIETN